MNEGMPVLRRPPTAYYPPWKHPSAAASLLDLPGKAMCALRISWPGGAAAEPPGQSGVMSVAVRAALAGAGGECVLRLERLGAEAVGDVTVDAAAVTLITQARHLGTAAALTQRAISEPGYADEDVANVVSQAANAARDRLSRPAVKAEQALLRAIYGEQSGLARHPAGDPEAIGRLTAASVRQAYEQLGRPAGARVYFVGDVARSGVQRVLEDGAFAAMLAGPPLARALIGETPARPPATVLVDQPSSRQAVLACGRLVRLRSKRAVAALEAAVHALAGWYGSRWHLRLREGSGLSYYVSADFAVRRARGAYLCEIRMLTAVPQGDSPDAVRLMREEITHLARGRLDAAELGQAVGWIVQSQKLYLQTPDQMAARQAQFVERGLPAGFGRDRARLLMALDAAEVTDAAAEHLAPDLMVLAGVGDPARLAPALRRWTEEP